MENKELMELQEVVVNYADTICMLREILNKVMSPSVASTSDRLMLTDYKFFCKIEQHMYTQELKSINFRNIKPLFKQMTEREIETTLLNLKREGLVILSLTAKNTIKVCIKGTHMFNEARRKNNE